MTTVHSDEGVPGPSGHSDKTAADRIIDVKVSMKVAQRIGKNWKYLGRVMGFEDNRLETMEIDNRSMGHVETVYRMLQEWQNRMSNGATVRLLAHHLTEVERGDLAHEILAIANESKMKVTFNSMRNKSKRWKRSAEETGYQQRNRPAPRMSKVELDGCWTTIKSALKMEHERKQIPKIPWLKDWEMDFETFYVDLTIADKNHAEPRALSLNEIFKSRKRMSVFSGFRKMFKLDKGNQQKRILIEGPAGYGKSTLACKLCYDHAKGRKYIQRFDAVILLHVRELEETLEEMIMNVLQLKDYTAEQVLETIKQKQEKVLFILDGYDELHEDMQNPIIHLLTGKQLTHTSFVVTSRLGNIALEDEKDGSSGINLLHCIDSRILIKGITGENRLRFLQLYVKDYCFDKVSSLISLVEDKFDYFKNQNVNLFDCPLFLVLLVIVNEEEGIDTIKTKTELYKKLFNFTLRRMVFLKEGQTDQCFDFFDFSEHSPPDYVEMLFQFGLLAGEAINDSKLYFSRKDILQNCGDILKLGILTQNESKSGHKWSTWYEPLHLSFLEFAFAYSVWIILVRMPSYKTFFLQRRVIDILTSLNLSNLVTSFFFGFCGKQLSATFSGCMFDRHYWQIAFTGRSDRNELTAESQLNISELAKVLMPLFASEIIVYPGRVIDSPSPLTGEILKHIKQTNGDRCIILEQQFITASKQPSSQQPLVVLPNTKDSEVKQVFASWGELITKVNIGINLYKSHCCAFAFILCNADPAEQLNWLSNWLRFEGLYFDKPINKVCYWCPKRLFAETLLKLAQLISQERVAAVKLFAENLSSDPAFEEFIRCANQSTRLLDMKIEAYPQVPLFVDLGGKEGKKWRKIELCGNVFPHLGNLHHTNNDFSTWDLESVIKELPSRIQTLRVASDAYDFMSLSVFVQHNASSVHRTLSELRVTISNNSECLRELFNSDYLNNLQVLAIGLPTDVKLNEEDIITPILCFISQCKSLVRIEMWEGCSEVFIASFLEALRVHDHSARRNSPLIEKTKLFLGTLMLTPEISRKNEELESTIINLAKELLLFGVLEQLWVSSKLIVDGYATLNFFNAFSEAEGFVCETEETSFKDSALWDLSTWDDVSTALYIFKISVKNKSKLHSSEA